MLFTRLSLVALASALISTVSGLKIIAPGGSALWWVAQSVNNIVWDCSDKTPAQFNVVVANPNVNVLTAPATILGPVDNFICSKSIPALTINFPAASNYTVRLTNILNVTDIYVTSEPFEIRPLGSAYPDPSSTPSLGASSGTPSSTSGGSKPSSTGDLSNSNKNSGSRNVLSALGAFAAVIVGVVTA